MRGEYFCTSGSKLAASPFNTAAIKSASERSIARDSARRESKSQKSARNSQGLLELGRKAIERGSDFRGLLGQSRHHALGRVRLVLDQIDRGNNQRQVVIDIMAHAGKLLIQLR